MAALAECLGRAGADELARTLPSELREPLAAAPETAEPFDAEEFVRRTAAREGGPSDQRAGTPGRCSPRSRRRCDGAGERARVEPLTPYL
jgi:hypothetical protein